MIRHTVAFKLKPLKNAGDEREFLKASKKLCTITGVKNFESLKQVSKKNNFDFGLSMEFTDQKAYDEYSNHPDHVAFIQKYWLTYVEDFIEIDYEPLDK